MGLYGLLNWSAPCGASLSYFLRSALPVQNPDLLIWTITHVGQNGNKLLDFFCTIFKTLVFYRQSYNWVAGTDILLLSSITKCHNSEALWLFSFSLHPTGCMLKKYNAYLFPIFRSGDSSARIWTIVDGPSSSSAQNGSANVVVLKHFRGRTNEKSKDVTTLDWSVSV